MVVAGVDAQGVAILGYQSPIAPAYSVTDTNTNAVVIKAANTAPPTAWKDLGLTVIITQDLGAGTVNLAFEGIFTNPTTRTGELEFGMRLNGTDLFRDIKVQISANFNQTIAMNIPLNNGYTAGDVVTLIARVPANNNNQFSLTMANSAVDVGVMRVYQVGTGGGGGSGGDAESVDGWSIAVVTELPPAPDPLTIYFVQGPGNGVTVDWADIANTPTTTGGYGITNAVTTTDNQTISGVKTFSSTIQGDISGNAGTAALATAVDDTGAGASLKFWYGTEAQYAAIPTKDATTVYFRSA